jgi:DNA repair photolyase
MRLKINEIKAKSILTPSKLPGADYVINPYVGCSFGCKYCYATFIGRWRHPGEEWGSFLDIKINAQRLLKQELKKLEKKYKSKDFGTIFLSSVTDPYVGLEAKYRITRQCLKALVDFGYEGEIVILTKSPLVTRDIDLFKKLNSSVGLTVTTLEDKVVRFLESYAPPASARIKALQGLYDAGIKIYCFVGPLLPFFITQEKKLQQLFKKLEEAGVKEIWIEHINLAPYIRERLYKFLQKEKPDLIRYFQQARTKEYRDKLEKMIYTLLAETNLKLAGGKVIFHNIRVSINRKQ